MMQLRTTGLVLAASLAMALPATAGVTWQRMEGTTVPAAGKRMIVPQQYLVFSAAGAALQDLLGQAPDNPDQAIPISLPMPDGQLRDFRVWRNGLLHPDLAARYPEIKTFTGEAVNDRRVTVKVDLTLKGFHAMVFDGSSTAFIDPYSDAADDYYIAYYKKDYVRDAGTLMYCSAMGGPEVPTEATGGTNPALRTLNGNQLRRYRLALACTGEYAAAVGGPAPTKASVLSAMVTTMNRVNGVYERELAATMQLISNEDTLIFLAGGTDPYSNNSGNSMLTQNQNTVTARIGDANYDIGHVFSTGGSGIAYLSSLCRSSFKAQGVTGSPTPTGDPYDIDYVAHEMGHQFGSDHTFNDSISGSCNRNAVRLLAYEPGGGTTLMAYAGICSPDDIQAHSDDYFHAKSLDNIVAYMTSAAISSCPVLTTSGNKTAAVPAFTQSYSIPYKTPFELTAPQAIDSVASTATTYCWEQWNLGDFGKLMNNTRLAGPTFRSFPPNADRTRVFPTLPKLLANTTTYLGERLPDAARFLTFRLSVRTMYNGIGSVHVADDSIHLDVINTGAPFLVTSPNTAVTWAGGTSQTVTWDVAGTTAAPINAAAVDIYLSADGGYTYPYTLATAVPNTGTATFALPNIGTTQARIKVKGSNNVFFDLSNVNFTITQNSNSVGSAPELGGIRIYPNPATAGITVQAGAGDALQLALVDLMGKTVWSRTFTGSITLPVGSLARGLYYVRISNPATGQRRTEKLVLQ